MLLSNTDLVTQDGQQNGKPEQPTFQQPGPTALQCSICLLVLVLVAQWRVWGQSTLLKFSEIIIFVSNAI